MGTGSYLPGEMEGAVKFSAYFNILPTLGTGVGGGIYGYSGSLFSRRCVTVMIRAQTRIPTFT